MEVLREHIIKRIGKQLSDLDKVLSQFALIQTSKNQLILREGEICRNVYFVSKGCLQVYVHDKDFNETTRDIVIEDNWCSELLSFSKSIPAVENIRCVEECELYAIDRHSFQQMVETVPAFDKVYKQILEASYTNSVYRINSFVSLSALERMKWLMDYRPALMTRLSSKLIASYLGIHKDVYSRLKAKL